MQRDFPIKEPIVMLKLCPNPRYADALNLKLNPEEALARAKEEAERKKKEKEEEEAAKATSEESMEVGEGPKDDEESADAETAEAGSDQVRDFVAYFTIRRTLGFELDEKQKILY